VGLGGDKVTGGPGGGDKPRSAVIDVVIDEDGEAHEEEGPSAAASAVVWCVYMRGDASYRS
jgi:hypothetical protein